MVDDVVEVESVVGSVEVGSVVVDCVEVTVELSSVVVVENVVVLACVVVVVVELHAL